MEKDEILFSIAMPALFEVAEPTFLTEVFPHVDPVGMSRGVVPTTWCGGGGGDEGGNGDADGEGDA